MLNKDCIWYLASVVDSEKNSKMIQEIPTVQVFIDIFSNDLPWMLHSKEIEFIVDLIHGVSLIFKTPYLIASIELKELKV